MEKQFNLLLVSNRSDSSESLLGVLHGLPVNALTTSTIKQAQATLSHQPISLIFCEENLPDGSYRDLLAEVHARYKKTRFAVVLSKDGWENYLDALRLGASDVVQCPLHPSEVAWVLIRAVRGELERQGLLTIV